MVMIRIEEMCKFEFKDLLIFILREEKIEYVHIFILTHTV